MKTKALTLVIFLLLFAPLGFTITQADFIPSPERNSTKIPVNGIRTNADGGTASPDQTAALTITKSALQTTYVAVGDVINYIYDVTNSGDTLFTGKMTVSDDKATNESCPAYNSTGDKDKQFDPGETLQCTGSYTITQADMDAGSVTNNASASAEGTTSPPHSVTVNGIQSAALTMVKTATPTTFVSIGDVIDYSFELTNSGDVTLIAPFTITDDKAIDEACPATPTSLAPNEVIICTASYTITQADLDAGSVTNTATGHGFFETTPVDSNEDFETVTKIDAPALTLVKTAAPTTYVSAGEVIEYSFVLTNSGNVTLIAPFSITDDKTTDESCPGTPTSLAPGASITCTAHYTITQLDVINGSVTNTATGHGIFNATPVDSNEDSFTINGNQNSALTIVKSVTSVGPYDFAGDVISYSYLLTNSGNVTLVAPFTITDNKATDETCPATPTSLTPGASIICTASYAITQADLDLGSVTNLASGHGFNGSTQVDSNQGSVTVILTKNPALTLVKTALPTTYNYVGQPISYSFALTNSGNVTLIAPFTITDDKTTNESCPATPTSLAPGASITCTSTYTITQADLDAGSVTNIATGHGSFGATTVNSNQDSETVTAAQGPALALDKTTPPPKTYNHVGQVISYSFLVTNTGNVNLAGPVTVSDDQTTNEFCPDLITVGDHDGLLDPGEFITCTASYIIKQSDLNFGSVTNVASANAGGITSPTDTETITAATGPALFIDKTAAPMVYDHPGQVISYSFKVENTGNVTLSGPFIVFDDKATDEACPSTPTSLDPGEFITCTASYTILQSDMAIGSVTNAAYATGKKGLSTITSNIDSETITAARIINYTFIPLTAVSRPGVHVLAVSYQYVSHETQFILGEVTNNSGNSITLVDVAVNFVGSGGNTVATGHAYLRPFDLPAWERGCFKISMNVPPAWSYYQLKDPTYNVSGTSPGLKIIDKSGSYDSNTGDYNIVGHIRNDGNQDSLSVDVSGTVYNAYGVPVGCEHNVINPDLSPGQVSSFDLNYLGYYRDYNDVSYYKLRVAGDLP